MQNIDGLINGTKETNANFVLHNIIDVILFILEQSMQVLQKIQLWPLLASLHYINQNIKYLIAWKILSGYPSTDHFVDWMKAQHNIWYVN